MITSTALSSASSICNHITTISKSKALLPRTDMETKQEWSSDTFSKKFLGCYTECIIGKCILFNSMIHYLGDIKGKSIMDVGCGEGIFCSHVKSYGASKVLGVDISSVMINAAKKDTTCQYQLGDARNLGKLGQFDYITANCSIVYAESIEELTDMFRSVYNNLKIGGRLVATIINSKGDTEWGSSLQKYGVPYYSSFVSSDEKKEKRLKAIISVGPDKPPFEATAKIFSLDDYRKALLAGGFWDFSFKECFANEEMKNSYPDGFWDVYTMNPCHLCIIADKK